MLLFTINHQDMEEVMEWDRVLEDSEDLRGNFLINRIESILRGDVQDHSEWGMIIKDILGLMIQTKLQ